MLNQLDFFYVTSLLNDEQMTNSIRYSAQKRVGSFRWYKPGQSEAPEWAYNSMGHCKQSISTEN